MKETKNSAFNSAQFLNGGILNDKIWYFVLDRSVHHFDDKNYFDIHDVLGGEAEDDEKHYYKNMEKAFLDMVSNLGKPLTVEEFIRLREITAGANKYLSPEKRIKLKFCGMGMYPFLCDKNITNYNITEETKNEWRQDKIIFDPNDQKNNKNMSIENAYEAGFLAYLHHPNQGIEFPQLKRLKNNKKHIDFITKSGANFDKWLENNIKPLEYVVSFLGGCPANIGIDVSDYYKCRIIKIINTYNKEISQAQKNNNDELKLLAIVKCIRALEISHPFFDHNQRIFVFLVLNKLLIQNGFHPAIMDNPYCFDGYLSSKELVSAVKNGIKNSNLLFKSEKEYKDSLKQISNGTQSSIEEGKKEQSLQVLSEQKITFDINSVLAKDKDHKNNQEKKLPDKKSEDILIKKEEEIKQQEDTNIVFFKSQSTKDVLLEKFLGQQKEFLSKYNCTTWEDVFIIAFSDEFAKDNTVLKDNTTLWEKIFDFTRRDEEDSQQDIKNKEEIHGKIINYLQQNWQSLNDQQKNLFKTIEHANHPIICSGLVKWEGSDAETKITFYQKLIGCGGSGEVFAIYPLPDNNINIDMKPIACKFLLSEHHYSNDPSKFYKKMDRERENMQQLKDCQNCVSVKGQLTRIYDDKDKNKNYKGILMQLIEGKPLSCYVYYDTGECWEKPFKTNLLKLAEQITWFEQIVKTINSIHQQGYVYGDLSFDNIMLSPDKQKICLIDFGSSRKIGEKGPVCGHHGFTAPELIDDKGNYKDDVMAHCSHDVYALGMMLATLFIGCDLYDNNPRNIEKVLTRKGQENDLPKNLVQKAIALIVKCFGKTCERPKIDEIIKEIGAIKKIITDSINNKHEQKCEIVNSGQNPCSFYQQKQEVNEATQLINNGNTDGGCLGFLRSCLVECLKATR